MRPRAYFPLIVLLVIATLLFACRRRPEATPTAAPTSVTAQSTATRPVEPTGAAATSPAPQPTAEALIEPIRMDPADIDWAPQLVQVSPGVGQEAPLDGPITIRFDQAMDVASVEEAFTVEEVTSGETVDGELQWTAPHTLVFTPEARLQRSGQYRVSIGQSARSENGQSLVEDIDFTVQTVGFLQVSEVVPGNGVDDVDPHNGITVFFNRPVVPLVGTAQQSSLPQPLAISPDVAGSGQWVSTSIYRFTPESGFQGAATYEVSIAAGLEDVTGGVLEDDFVWRFSTAQPSVASIEPSNGATDISPTAPLTVTFSVRMDQASVEEAIALDPAHNVRFEWQEDGRTVVLHPEERLDVGTQYTLTVGNSATAAGGQATLDRQTSSSFRTVPLPAVIFTSPARGAETPAFQSGISIEFASPMDPQTIEGRIQINPAPEDEPDYFFSPQGRFVSVNFTLERNRGYTITVPGDVADPYGNTLGADYTWTFTTAPLAPLASLNLPSYITQLSDDFPSNVTLLQRNVSSITMALYDVGLPLSYLADPARISDFSLPGDALRTWNFEPATPLDTLGQIEVNLAGDSGALPTGVYLLDVSSPAVGDEFRWWQVQRVFLVVAGANLVVKETFDGVHVWATDLASGLPLAGLDLTLYDWQGEQAGTAATDGDGLATFDYAPSEEFLRGVVVVSGSAGDAQFGVAGSSWDQGVAPWNFALPVAGDEPPEFAYIYTDRPIYRPGDTVYFRGILRETNYARYNLPQRQSVQVRVDYTSFFEPEQSIVDSLELDVSAAGTFAGEFFVPEGASLGQYRIFLSDEAATVNAQRHFTVADYRNPEFMVTVTPQQDELLRGESVDVVVEARYFFGAPAADLPVAWTVSQMPYYFPWEGRYYSFSDEDIFYFWEGQPGGFFGEFVTGGSGHTDANGQLVLTLPADLLAEAEDGSRVVSVNATINDISEFAVTANGQVVFHAAETYVGIAPEDYLNSANNEALVDLLTVDWAGRPVANQEVEVVFFERDYEFVRDELRGAGFGRWEADDTEVDRVVVTTNSQGEAQAPFTPEEGGTYRALASATDANGQTHRSSVIFWVNDQDFVAWRTNPDEKRMDLTPDQRTYEVGDTARILVQSPFSGPVQAWLMIERGVLLEQRLITLQSNSDVIEIPISEALSPNAFVSVVAIQGAAATGGQVADIRLGMTELVAPPDRLSLNVELTPQDEILAPGENITYEIRVTNYAGQPLQAEVSLALVDLAVLTLQADNAPPIVDAFYERQPFRSRMGSGLFVSGEGLDVNIPQEELGLGGGGGGGDVQDAGRVLEEEDDVRRNFPDTAFWRADLLTDENGMATVEVPLPDSVTTWRLSSKAVTADTLVGQSSVDVVATLPLLIRPVTPRFMTVNDELLLGAIVNNNSSQSMQVEVTLQAEGVTINDELSKEVTVAANSQQLVRWQVTVDDVTFADLIFRAQGGGFADATKPTFGVGPDQLIPVYRYNAEDLVGSSGVVEEAGRRVEAILVPPQVDAREGDVVVSLSPSLAAALIETLEAIDSDPELQIESACAPGVVSHFLPNLATVRALRQLGLPEPELAAQLDSLVERAIDRLAALQMADGGWGWCYADHSDPYLTAYVLFGLAKAVEAGFDVSAVGINRALFRLEIRDPRSYSDVSMANRQAFFLYVRAELQEGSLAAMDALFEEHRDLLDPYARAYLALGYELMGEHGSENQQTLMSDLVNDAILSATGAHWEDAERDRFNLSSDIRGTAVVLDALARIEPESGVAAQAVRWLMAARRASFWPTIFETVWSVIALTDWMAASGELEADFAYRFSLNGSEMAAGQFARDNITEAVEVAVPMGHLMPNEPNFLMFDRDAGPGRLYYTAHLDAFVNAESVEAVSRGITVQRVYYDAACDPEQFTCQPLDTVQAGQTVRVELTLVARNDLQFVRLEDALPAGAEAVDPGLLTSAPGLGGSVERVQNSDYRAGYWGWWIFNRIEYRDEKVVFYSNFMPAGSYQYSYFLEPTIPGTFQVRPAIAYEEFFPEVFGRSSGASFTIEE